jgi:hypothetical protein
MSNFLEFVFSSIIYSHKKIKNVIYLFLINLFSKLRTFEVIFLAYSPSQLFL